MAVVTNTTRIYSLRMGVLWRPRSAGLSAVGQCVSAIHILSKKPFGSWPSVFIVVRLYILWFWTFFPTQPRVGACRNPSQQSCGVLSESIIMPPSVFICSLHCWCVWSAEKTRLVFFGRQTFCVMAGKQFSLGVNLNLTFNWTSATVEVTRPVRWSKSTLLLHAQGRQLQWTRLVCAAKQNTVFAFPIFLLGMQKITSNLLHISYRTSQS